jgi:hypothetical protein
MTSPARDERRWTLYRYGPTWFVADVVEPMAAESVEVMPVAAHEEALAAARQVDEAADVSICRYPACLADGCAGCMRVHDPEREWVDDATIERALHAYGEARVGPHATVQGAMRAALLAALTVPESDTGSDTSAAANGLSVSEPEDCRGCGAPAGLPPAGPCADHGTEHARAVPEPEGRSWRERVGCTCQAGDGSVVCPREDECMAAWHEDQGPTIPEPEEKR